MNVIHKIATTLWILMVSALLITSCNKGPKPAFSYTPATNIEVGDTVYFTNESENATSYSWNFGNGMNSNEENPSVVYEQVGEVYVSLAAMGEEEEVSTSEKLTINEPTGLGFFIYQDDEQTLIPNAEILLFDNQEDFDNGEDPQYSTVSDTLGVGLFLNLEPITYWVFTYKEVDGGFWGAAFDLDPLVQNELIVYNVFCVFISDDELKSAPKSSLLKASAGLQVQNLTAEEVQQLFPERN